MGHYAEAFPLDSKKLLDLSGGELRYRDDEV